MRDGPDVVNGFMEIAMPDWHAFMNYVTTNLIEFDSYIWRGQRDPSWKLEPTIDRLCDKSKWFQAYETRESVLENFQYACRGRRGRNPPPLLTENEWWALGQHFGLATPLLDWSHSPFVAAYFALHEEVENDSSGRAVFALYKPSIEIRAAEILNIDKAERKRTGITRGLLGGSTTLAIEFFKPFSDENQRLVNQNGLFSRSNSGEDIEEWVGRNFVGSNHMILIKFVIPTSARVDGLKVLNRMNINHLTLFPDLDGAAKFCNMKEKITGY